VPASRVCSVPGCPTLTTGGRCAEHQRQAEQIRGSATSRGYGNGHSRFRQLVLRRDPVCVIPECTAPSTVADHYPLSRRDLVLRRMDPNDPKHGRGLCASCHGKATAEFQPGGWNNR
jgi:5-methylcytosine-specific restriction protein A